MQRGFVLQYEECKGIPESTPNSRQKGDMKLQKLKQEYIGKYLIRETYGIVFHVFCTRCGKNLPWLEYECPNCDKVKESGQTKEIKEV